MNTFKIISSLLKHTVSTFFRKEKYEYNEDVQDIVKKIKKDGYIIIPNFYTSKECQILRDEIDRLIDIYKDENILWRDTLNCDQRLYMSNDRSELINRFYKDKFLSSVAENYFKGKMSVMQTLGSKLSFVKDNKGSGGGWHRDANFFQFKCILYLSNVDNSNGPFQIIENSHKLKSIIKDTTIMRKKSLDVRISDDEIERLINIDSNRYKQLISSQGTLIFVDSSCIHSGKPIEYGSRYTLFNYFYPSYDDVKKRKSDFIKVMEGYNS